MQQTTVIKISLSALAIAIISVIVLYVVTSTQNFGEKAPRSLAELGGNFSLQSVAGDVALSDFKGKTVVMYFGFMTCPEVCPNSMGVIKNAFNQLEQTQLDAVQGMMISIDPDRDTLENLNEFAQYFHPNIIGVTGEKAQLEQLGKQYGAYFEREQDTDNDYLFRHSSRYYVINSKGVLIDAMRHSTTANELAARINSTF